MNEVPSSEDFTAAGPVVPATEPTPAPPLLSTPEAATEATTEPGTEATTEPAAEASVDASADDEAGRSYRWLKVLVAVVLAVVWVRFVLFAWLFPIVERRFDSPELREDASAAAAPMDPAAAG